MKVSWKRVSIAGLIVIAVALAVIIAVSIINAGSPLRVASDTWDVKFPDGAQVESSASESSPMGDGYRYVAVSVPKDSDSAATILDPAQFSAGHPGAQEQETIRGVLTTLQIDGADAREAAAGNAHFSYRSVHSEAGDLVVARNSATGMFYLFEFMI